MRHTLLYIVAVVLTLTACSSRPDGVLSAGRMEDVLYDLHRAHFLPEQGNGSREDGPTQRALMLSVLRQHDVTQAEWDSSMVYYTRNADELETVYASLMERLDYEASIMGAANTEVADTTDIWPGEKHVLLMQNEIATTYQWTLPTDSLLTAGERVTLRFLGLFLNPDAPRRATALLVMKLANDSTITSHQAATQNGIYSVELTDDEFRGIRSVSGLFMLHRPTFQPFGDNAAGAAQNQVFSIADIRLLHEKRTNAAAAASPSDTLRPSPLDTLQPMQRPERQFIQRP